MLVTISLTVFALHVRPPRAGRVCAQLDPTRLALGRDGLYTPPPAPVPSIAVLADKQTLATLLASNWAEAAGTTGGFSGDTVEVGPSAVHGLGLIARRDLEEGTMVTLYTPTPSNPTPIPTPSPTPSPSPSPSPTLPGTRYTACCNRSATDEARRASRTRRGMSTSALPSP